MRILFAILYDANYGVCGAEQVVYDLTLGMRDIFHEEVACVVNPGDLADRLRAQGVSVTEVSFSKWETPQVLKRLGHLIDTWKPDIIFSHHRYMTFLLDLFFKNKTFIVHTEELLHHNKRFLFRYGHLAVGCHESVRKNLVSFYRIPEERTLTIDNTTHQPPVNSEELKKIQQKYPKKKGQIYGLSIGRLEEQKGQRYLAEALARLSSQERERLHIFIAGKGTMETFLMSEAKRLGVSDSITFLGYVDAMGEWLDFCDFVILPSLWEGSPLTLRLAYGASRPLLAADIEGIREFVIKEKTGFLFPPRNAEAMANIFKMILSGDVQLEVMGRQARAYWEANFTLEKMVRAYHSICENRMKKK